MTRSVVHDGPRSRYSRPCFDFRKSSVGLRCSNMTAQGLLPDQAFDIVLKNIYRPHR
jgi:hypothetical protein